MTAPIQHPISGEGDGWIKHNGEECPVALDAHVEIKWMDDHGEEFSVGKADDFYWPVHTIGNPQPGDIIAYRVIPSATADRQQGEGK